MIMIWANSMNDYFCSVGRNLSDKILAQPNPFLSHHYDITNPSNGREQFKFVAINMRTEKPSIRSRHRMGLAWITLPAIS